jgi:HK97 family phage portal protein
VGLLSSFLQPTTQVQAQQATQQGGEARGFESLTAGMVRNGAAAVSPPGSMALATVFACVRVLSESVSMLPLVLYERTKDGRRRADNHPLSVILQSLPNPEITSVELRMALMGHLALWGNAYAQIVRAGGGRVLELWPLRPDSIEIQRAPDGTLVYAYATENGSKTYFPKSEIFHIRGISSDGLMGYSPVATARRSFESANERSQYQSAFYANGARPGGVLRHPGKLSDAAYNRIRSSWETRHQGAANANRVAVLEEGMDYAGVGIPQSDQQFIQQEQLDAARIASIFRVPSHMVNDLERATFSNIEEMSQEFVDYSLAPWFVVWEQAIARDLLTESERRKYYAKHVAQALLRGNATTRSQFYSTGLQWGYFSINDVRGLEDLNSIEGGDQHFVPLNMVPLDQAAAVAAAQAQAQATPVAEQAQRSVEHPEGCTCGAHAQRSLVTVTSETVTPGATRAEEVEDLRVRRVELALAELPLLEDIAQRLVRREVRDVSKALDKYLKKRASGQDEFGQWLKDFYADFNHVVEDAHRAALNSYARQAMLAAASELKQKPKGLTDDLRQFVGEYLSAMGNQWAASSRYQLEALLSDATADGVDPAPLVEERLAGWEKTRPKKHADGQAFEALNAFVIASYGSYKVTRWQWVSSGKSCPFCRSLDGKIAGKEVWFVPAGGSVDAGDGSPAMLIRRNVGHGPLHAGCDCIVVAITG